MSQWHPECIDIHLGSQVLLEMIVVPPGECRRFSYVSEEEFREEPEPIRVPRPFLLGKYPVTVAQWMVIAETSDELREYTRTSWIRMQVENKSTPEVLSSRFANRTPVSGVTAEMAVLYCRRLSEFTGMPFSLPNEDEWEYACRGGTDDPYPVGDPQRYPRRYFRGSVARSGYLDPEPLSGNVPPNRFGLLGMQAYMREWCVTSPHHGDAEPYALRGSSMNSNSGLPNPAWDRRAGNCRAYDKAGGYGLRLRCDWGR
jgi:formylglycine-generating enzyme required for sulfatase activity